MIAPMSTSDSNNHGKATAREPRRNHSEPGEAVRPLDQTACPTALELAAYIEGRADELLVDRMDVHLARCPACLELVRQIRSAEVESSDSMIFVPPHLLEAAMGLVPGESGESWEKDGGDAAASPV